MSCKIHSPVLAVCIMGMAACLGMAADNPKPETVVYLGRSSTFALPTEADAICGRLLREMMRQSFLVAARDQLGLPTRDASLGDEMPAGGDNAPFDMHTTASKAGEQNFVEVNRGFAKPGAALMHAIIEFKPMPVDDIHRETDLDGRLPRSSGRRREAVARHVCRRDQAGRLSGEAQCGQGIGGRRRHD